MPLMTTFAGASARGFRGAAAPPAAISYRTAAQDASNLTTYTFTGKDIGTASADRYVVVGVHGASAAARTISSVTIGGNAASPIVSVGADGAGASMRTALYGLLVPTGTTADIVVTFSSGCADCAIGIWALTGLQSMTATATNTSTSSTGSLSGNVSAGGVAIAMSSHYHASAGTSTTWSGLTEKFDTAFDTNASTTGASDSFATAQTPLAVTSTPSGTNLVDNHVFASFR